MRTLLFCLALLGIFLCCPVKVSAIDSNQAVTCSQLVSMIGSGFSWSGSSQTCASGTLIVTRAWFVAYIKNNGSCSEGSLGLTTYILTYSDMQACAINYTQHTSTISSGFAEQDYTCTYKEEDSTETCTDSDSTEPGTMITMSSSTVAPTTSSTQLSISVSGVSLSNSCSAPSPTWYLQLVSPGGTVLQTWGPFTSSSISETWYGGSAAAGAYSWSIGENMSSDTCAGYASSSGDFTSSISWTGTSASSYY